MLTLPDDLGPLTQSGKKTPTICPKGSYQIYAVGADYPAYEASYPKNLSQLPRDPGAERTGRRHDLRSAQRFVSVTITR